MDKKEYKNEEWYKNAIAFGITEEEIEEHFTDISIMSSRCLPLKEPFDEEPAKKLIKILLGNRNFSERLKLLYFIHKMSTKFEHVKEYSNFINEKLK